MYEYTGNCYLALLVPGLKDAPLLRVSNYECSELIPPCNGGLSMDTSGTFTCDGTGTGFEGPTCAMGT